MSRACRTASTSCAALLRTATSTSAPPGWPSRRDSPLANGYETRTTGRSSPCAQRRGFDDLAGSELVATLVQSGNAQDEAVADSLVRLAKADCGHSPGLDPALLAALQQSIANIPMPQLDPASLALLQESIAKIALPQLASAILASLRESIAPTAARIVAQSGAAQAMREIAARAPADVATTNVRQEHREAQRILSRPATKRAVSESRTLV